MTSRIIEEGGASRVPLAQLVDGEPSKATGVALQVLSCASGSTGGGDSDIPVNPELEGAVEQFFKTAQQLPQSPEDLHDNEWVEAYQNKRDQAEKRLGEIKAELDQKNTDTSKKVKNRRKKLKGQYDSWLKKYTLCDLLVGIYYTVDEGQWSDVKQQYMIKQLPKIAELGKLSGADSVILADLCIMWLQHEGVDPKGPYSVLMSNQLVKDKKELYLLGDMLRWGASCLAGKGCFALSAKLFCQSLNYPVADYHKSFKDLDRRMVTLLSSAFMHSGEILGCSDTSSALRAITYLGQKLIKLRVVKSYAPFVYAVESQELLMRVSAVQEE